MSSETRRAAPLAPDERRRSIVDAVIPLIVEQGAAVTTREMAEAAGVAEGTIYKVFPDKPSIILEAIRVSMDPDPTRSAIEAIPDDIPLADQAEVAARILMDRADRLVALVSVLGTMPEDRHPDHEGAHRQFEDAQRVVVSALTELFERHAGHLRVPPDRAAVMLRGLVFVNKHPRLSPAEQWTASEIVAMALHGVSTASSLVDA